MISTERKLLAGAPGAALGVFLSLHPLFQALLILQAIDFVTGFLVAWSQGTVSSEASRKGFVKKAIALLLIVALRVLTVGYKIEIGFDLAASVSGWFCLTEVISIAENAARAGWALPSFLMRALHALKDQAERKDEKPRKRKGSDATEQAKNTPGPYDGQKPTE